MVIVPLVFEIGEEAAWDAIICVACAGDLQISRLVRKGMSMEHARKRMGRQMISDIHQALITTLVTQLGKAKFIGRPLSRSQT